MIKIIIIVLLVFLIAYLLINFTKKTENYSNPTSSSSASSTLPNGRQDQLVSSQYFNLGCDNIQSITHSNFSRCSTLCRSLDKNDFPLCNLFLTFEIV